MNASRYMDKQIMDLTASSSPNSTAGKDFLDLMNHPQDEDNHANQSRSTSVTAAENGTKKDEMFPSYDFQPIRPLTAHLDGGTANSRVWNSVDAKSKNYGALNSIEPEKTIIEKDRDGVDVAIVSEIDRTMKKHADNLMHALEGVSARLTQMETRTRQLESSVDDLKASVGINYGSSDGKMRHLENIMREVQTGIQVLKDKQDLLEAHLLVSKPDQPSEAQNATHMDSIKQAASAPVQSHQPLPPAGSFPQPQVSGPPALSQQNLSPPVQHPNQFPQSQVPSVPQPDPYYPPPTQTQEAPNQQYQMPPTQQLQPPPAAPPHQPFPPASQPQYSQPQGPPQPPQHQPPLGHRPEEPSHISSQGYAPNLRQPPSQPPQAPQAQHQPPLGHHPEEPPYIPSQVYPPNLRQPPSQPPSVSAPPQQYYGAPAPPHVYDPPQSRPSFPPSVPTEPYSSYGGPPSQYGSSAPMKNQQHLSLPTPQNAGTGYPQLPTARLLPQGLPTASGVGSGSGSPGSGNRVPLDDVVDKVTSMGFSRDLVRETVRKLTENGQSVDLNVVLDKLMNDGEVQQPPRGWFNR